MTSGRTIRVQTPQPYDVVVGRDLLGQLVGCLPPGVRTVGLITSERLSANAAAVRNNLIAAGLEVCEITTPDGEAAKTAEVAATCWSALGEAGLTRSDAIVGVGGGSTTDLAGFVAATYLRGLPIVQLPTTLLAMVDAAVGGKTGINTPTAKNLVGAFHEPAAVLCDLDRLRTLDTAELVSGLAEVVKCGLIADPEILDVVESDSTAALDPGGDVVQALVEKSVAVKADIVAKDLRERTSHGSDVGREALNYGHTLGHAIERIEDYRIRHGEAVAVGMVFAAELARLDGRLGSDIVDRHRSALRSVRLPTSYDRADWESLLALMRVDKKARGDVLRFVVLDGIARPAILEGPRPDLLAAAFDAVSG
jgi:3-dehydroquinate synthase